MVGVSAVAAPVENPRRTTGHFVAGRRHENLPCEYVHPANLLGPALVDLPAVRTSSRWHAPQGWLAVPKSYFTRRQRFEYL
jgi:hypothetical protein